MTYLKWFAYPYKYLIQDWVTVFVPAIMVISVLCVLLDWILPAADRQKGRLTLLLLAINMFLYNDQYVHQNHILSIFLVCTAAILLLVYGIFFRSAIKVDWVRDLKPPVYWSGLLIILIVTGIKLVELSTWPPFLKTYAGMTGKFGMNAVEHLWPDNLFQGRGFDLRGGGASPLMLPVMWLVMKFAGVTVFSVRFSEVIGSTVLLLILWSWLRVTIPGKWSLIALSFFALSPWHLAQSRMGTFFSISSAVALGILWSAGNVWRSEKTWRSIGWWALLGFFAGCIGWAYAPMKVLYPFFILALVAIPFLKRFKPAKWWIGWLVSLLVFSAVFGVQLSSVSNPSSMFKSHFGPLATDNPVWRKTVDDKVQNGIQPVKTIAVNVKRNATEWANRTFGNFHILPIYAYAVVASIVVTILCFVNWWNPVLGAYFLFGLLPPLIIFPLHRRTLIMWPLVYITAVVIFREITITASAMFRKTVFKRSVGVLVGLCVMIIICLGLQIWINTWSIVLDHTYFGPAWRLTAIHKAEELMPVSRVVFVNPWVHRDTIEISLYEQNKSLGGDSLMFANIGRNAQRIRQFLALDKPTAFIFFDLDNQEWLKDAIKAELPGGQLEEIHNKSGRRELLYSVYSISQ